MNDDIMSKKGWAKKGVAVSDEKSFNGNDHPNDTVIHICCILS